MRKTDEIVSSQKSPSFYCAWGNHLNENLYTTMLKEDYCFDFSLEFASLNDSDRFFLVLPEGDKLKYLLEFSSDYRWYRDFCEVLSKCMYSLMLNGKAYVEIVFLRNAEGDLLGISLEPVVYTKAVKRGGIIRFSSHTHSGEKLKYEIKDMNLVILDLKDIGLRRGYFIKLAKKLAKIDFMKCTDFSLDKRSNFDITIFTQKAEYRLLWLTRKIHWLGRNFGNQYLSEAYLLYKMSMYKKMRWKILDYFVASFNSALDRFGNEFGFTGKIIINMQRIDYDKHFADLSNGKINTSQMSKIVN